MMIQGAKIYSDFVKPRQIWEAKKWLENMAEHSKCQVATETRGLLGGSVSVRHFLPEFFSTKMKGLEI